VARQGAEVKIKIKIKNKTSPLDGFPYHFTVNFSVLRNEAQRKGIRDGNLGAVDGIIQDIRKLSKKI
jgi:hypothetical protein